jgi:hypothetical protein
VIDSEIVYKSSNWRRRRRGRKRRRILWRVWLSVSWYRSVVEVGYLTMLFVSRLYTVYYKMISIRNCCLNENWQGKPKYLEKICSSRSIRHFIILSLNIFLGKWEMSGMINGIVEGILWSFCTVWKQIMLAAREWSCGEWVIAILSPHPTISWHWAVFNVDGFRCNMTLM